MASGLVDRGLDRLLADDLTVAEVAIEHRHGVGLADHLGAPVGHDRAVLHLADVLRHADHAMRIVAGQIGVDQTGGDLPGLLRRRARRRQYGRRELSKPIRRV